MSRLEKYRQMRNLRQKYTVSILLFLFFLAAGICIADSSINGLMSGGTGAGIFSVTQYENSIRIVFMNQELYLNTQYVRRDMKNLQNGLDRLVSAARGG